MKKERFVDWWKQDKRYMTLLKAVLMALLPLLCCLVRTAAEGRSIGQVYLPSSEWNDELFYFKQVEGIVNYGFPRGYFGFNESHALRLSFAAWSPVLVFPWILWGLLFGWNLLSPVICNIVLLTITMFVFVWLVKPTWKQLGILTVLFSLYSLFVRYMLSGMPEVISFVNIEHSTTLCFCCDCILSLLLCTYEKNCAAICYDIRNRLISFINLTYRLL